ncbi:MAG: hypothetical protein NVSMB64_21730 [Candidatus Velthaea sp.]
MSRLMVGAALGAVLLSGCSHAERLANPNRIDEFCRDRAPRYTAILSVVSSSGDQAESVPVPSAAEIRKTIHDESGVIAHWDGGQPLLKPNLAKSLGYVGDYVTVQDAAIVNRLSGTDSRRMYLTVRLNTGTKTIPVRAYDLQDICSEGKLSP